MRPKKYDTPAAKQRAYRQRKDPVKGTLTRIRRFLSLHPEKVKALDAFMLDLAAKVSRDAQPHWMVTGDDHEEEC